MLLRNSESISNVDLYIEIIDHYLSIFYRSGPYKLLGHFRMSNKIPYFTLSLFPSDISQ